MTKSELKKLKYGACGTNKNKPCWVYFFHIAPSRIPNGAEGYQFVKVGVTNSGTPHDRYKGINKEGIVKLYDIRGLSHFRLNWEDYPEANTTANQIESNILSQWEIEGGLVNKRGPSQIDLLYSHKGNSEILLLSNWTSDLYQLITMVGTIINDYKCTPPTDPLRTESIKDLQT